MKMVKSLLLGSAAGLVAVTAGQAADLPVKAQPVQYVKVCSLYGAGFYYMPGTDTCIKIGGWIRAEAMTGNTNGSSTWGSFAGQENIRTTNNTVFVNRGYITADAREQTAYGVARGYLAVGMNSADVGTAATENIVNLNRGYVQFAGFTAGLAQSFYDFYCVPCAQYYLGGGVGSDTGNGGWQVFGYTANFGGGFSATIAAEQRRMMQIIGQGATSATFSNGASISSAAAVGTGYGGFNSPDIVANLRIDQAWGSAQVMGAAHEVNAPYYGAAAANQTANGGPGITWGYAAGAGVKFNAPFISPGDYFQTQFNYTVGAMRYLDHGEGSANFLAENGGTEGFGIESDCVYGGTTAANETGCNLTTAWGVNASYEHYWTPNFHESVWGNYQAITYNTQANNILCVLEGSGNGAAGLGSAALATAGCSNNWTSYAVGSRLQYDVTKSLYVGVEGLYNVLQSGTQPGGLLGAGLNLGSPGPAAGTQTVSNESGWIVRARIHKDFLP